MIDKKEKEYQEFGEFVFRFVKDLNDSAEQGWSVLVEGKRDAGALRKLGFKGELWTAGLVSRTRRRPLFKAKVIVLTDLDREGAVLASRFIKTLGHDGAKISLSERRRLKKASRGVFLHIENLSRFV